LTRCVDTGFFVLSCFSFALVLSVIVSMAVAVEATNVCILLYVV